MNINKYPEIQPKTKLLKKMYIFIMLLLFGRAMAAEAEIDDKVKEIYDSLPDDFMLAFGVSPGGPWMVLGKDKKDNGKVKYFGWKTHKHKITQSIKIRNIEAAMRMFTFRESTSNAYCHDRFVSEGDNGRALGIVSIMDVTEFHMLPKIITKLGVKRYPKWSEMSPLKKYVGRVRVYLKVFSPSLVKVIFDNL